MIYKQRSLKRWNFDSTFPEDLINIGTQSNESILRARGRNFFFSGPTGYETNGGYPNKISRPIQRIVDAIPASFTRISMAGATMITCTGLSEI